MRSLSFLLTVTALLTFAPRVARAGCPQAGDGCDAVVTLDAALQGGPACVTIDHTEAENGCVCQGTVHVKNGCAVELVATDFTWNSSATTVAAGAIGTVDVDEGGALGAHHDELTLESGGQTFKLILDYTIEHRAFDASACSAAGDGPFGALGVGVALSALAFARRRQNRRAK